MAERRMFTKKVTDSDAFIELSSSTQALYFHLNQGADDDGFNNQIQNAMFKAHASIDDLKILLMKNFIIRFESGVIVIKHWRMHNTLRKDRYTPTNFQDELRELHIESNGIYALDGDGCQVVAKRLPQDSIGKISIDKNNILSSKLDEADEIDEKIEYENNSIYLKIIDYLNHKCNTNFRTSTKKTRTLIDTRLKEGFKEDDFITVIDKKSSQWLNNKEMCKFLRPETLFGNKFEGYLNEQTINIPKPSCMVEASREEATPEEIEELEEFFKDFR